MSSLNGRPTDANDHPADEYLVPQSSDEMPTLSVVMPTLNEEEGVAESIERIKNAIQELGVSAEIIVSDSSDDRTPEIAEALGAHVVTPDGRGYGYAYRYAFECVRGDYVVMGDADCTYDFEAIPKLLAPIRNGDADMVMGSRLEGEIEDGSMPWLHRYVGNPLLTAFLNVFYDADVSDAHSGFRIFTREALEEMDLEADGMEFASEMVMDATVRDLDIEEVPITYHERKGEETLDSFRDGWRHVKFMLVNAPGYLFSLPGALLFTVGLVLMGATFSNTEISGIFGDPVRFGVRSMIAGSLLTIVGYQVGSLGIFATLASDPIRQPEDPVTQWIVRYVDLERGGVVGLTLFLSGSAYSGWILWRWWTGGYGVLPPITHDIVGFTAIVLGVQTVFSSFFLSAIGNQR